MKKQDFSRQIRGKLRWGIVAIFAALLISASFDAPKVVNPWISAFSGKSGVSIPTIPEKEFTLGLDLQGGAHLIYRADVSSIEEDDKGASVEGVRDVIQRRVDGLGVGEANIQTARVAGEYRVNVELPGIDDVNQAITMIGETPILEFREESNEPPRDLTEEERIELAQANQDAVTNINKARAAITNGTSFEDAVQEYSRDSASIVNNGYIGFISDQQSILPELFQWAQANDEGDISDVIETDVGYHILKRGGTKNAGAGVDAREIQLCFLGLRSCQPAIYTKQEAKEKAQELFDQANADNFAELARTNSTDLQIAGQDGQLPLITEGSYLPEIEKALFDAEAGQILGPIESPLGFHVLYKVGEENIEEFEISHIFIPKTVETDIVPALDPWKPTKLGGKQLERAEVAIDHQTGAIQVSLQFDKEGADLFEELTRQHVGEPIAIYLDGAPISIPTVQQIISGGQAVITGPGDLAEARLLAQRLNAGALPVPIELISQQTIGASLGAESLAKSLKAGMAGILLVMLFMMLYYRFPGILAVVALSLYISVTLFIFKMMGVTLSLAGIAGFILSIGMAVDANVLIFERLKEELREGKSLKAAVEEGFARAWTSIRDGNTSTLITCALLMWFGSSFVQGFALTLAIGIILSMISAISITRIMLRFVVKWFESKSIKGWFLGAK